MRAFYAYPSLLIASLLLLNTASAQEKPLTKDEERAKFHPVSVKGMAWADREKSFLQHQKMDEESFFGGIKWRNVGPEVQAGRALAIRSPLNLPKSKIVAYATGGLYRTDDEGDTWTSLFEGQSAFGIGDFAVSKDGQTIYVGSGEANSQRTSYSGTGVFKSTDGGKTWKHMGLGESHHIGQVVIDPKNEKTIWVATLGHLYSQNDERGVYKSTDGGVTWKQMFKVDEFTGAIDLILDPRNPEIAIVSMWDRDRRAWNFRESGKGSGVFRTTNGGKNWTLVDSLPKGNSAGRTGLAMAASNPNIIYAFPDNEGPNAEWATEDERVVSGKLTPRRFLLLDETAFGELDKKVLEAFWKTYGPTDLKLEDALDQVKNKKLTMLDIRQKLEKKTPLIFEPGIIDEELYRSEDGGKSFKRVVRFGSHGGYYYGRVFVNPKNADDVWTGGVIMLRSTDGGKSWAQAAESSHADQHSVYFDPLDADKIWVGTDGGVYISPNNGKTWRILNNQSIGQATTLAVRQEQAPYAIYTGLQDNGTLRGSSDYRPGRSPVESWKSIGGGDGSAIALDPRTELDLVYVASQFGGHVAVEQKTGSRYPAAARAPRGETPFRYNWISPIVVSSHSPDIVYLGSQKLHRSFNRGRTWQAISEDLTRNKPNGDVPHSTLKDISESPLRFGLIYCGSDDGRMSMTLDGGFQWINIDTPEPTKWISRVVASRHEVGTVYVSQSGYREDDFKAYLWKSTDFGKTWTSIVGNMPNETINVVREDPKSKDTLYVGTDMGVFVTFDGGKNWEPLPGGLGYLPVHDLQYQEVENELVIATHAKGIFIMPMKQVKSVTPELKAAPLTILTLDDLEKSDRWGYDRKELWDKTAPRNPGFDLDFFSNLSGKTTIQLLDKDKKVVKEYSLDAVKGFNSIKLDVLVKAGDPFAPPAPKPTKASEIIADPYRSSRPVYLGVGEYEVVITRDGKSINKKVKITG